MKHAMQLQANVSDNLVTITMDINHRVCSLERPMHSMGADGPGVLVANGEATCLEGAVTVATPVEDSGSESPRKEPQWQGVLP